MHFMCSKEFPKPMYSYTHRIGVAPTVPNLLQLFVLSIIHFKHAQTHQVTFAFELIPDV